MTTFRRLSKRLLPSLVLPLLLTSNAALSAPKTAWFEQFKQQATPEQMYRFLHAMPKGGDLHNHLSGSNFSEWWYDLATDQQKNGGYHYFTKVIIKQCNGFGNNEFGFSPQLLLFRTLQQSSYDKLSACEKSEYKALEELNPVEKAAWMDSIRLDKKHEGRQEFFSTHWQRLNELPQNPFIMAEMLVENMKAFSHEGLVYLETQENNNRKIKVDGTPYTPEEAVAIFKQRLKQKDAVDTGMTVRMQTTILRFLPSAEKDLEDLYHFVDQNRDLYVSVNMVGREDDDKGHPLRFLPTLRKLRKTIPEMQLSIHAGEVDEPNSHVRDTLLLGATRIGHGVNLISDPDTMLLMRNEKALVEINLISNLLLEYVSDYSQHPFPEYLRTGIPVTLSTDDRGMWESNITDEYYVAVKEFDLSWDEILTLGRNSLAYSFVEDDIKQELLKNYDKRMNNFVKAFAKNQSKIINSQKIQTRDFICERYEVCLADK
ncbi:adenosine deaminase [Alteromonadaceae bacterium M269]|nr:adenosine deaminase [Alteromonadaceae bacterium M269]